MNRRQWLLLTLPVTGIVGLLLAAAIAGSASPSVAETRVPASPPPAVNPFAAEGMQDPSAPAITADVGIPIAVRIPSIGVESTLEDLAVDTAGALSPPVDFARAGWYVGGPAPGEIGPAIIAGHVDSAVGPAVFFRLAELQDGDQIIVDTDTGASLTFTVTGRTQSAKAAFPSDDVYSNVPRPELRLITCAGFFDRSVGHYTDNLIVFASLAT